MIPARIRSDDDPEPERKAAVMHAPRADSTLSARNHLATMMIILSGNKTDTIGRVVNVHDSR